MAAKFLFRPTQIGERWLRHDGLQKRGCQLKQ